MGNLRQCTVVVRNLGRERVYSSVYGKEIEVSVLETTITDATTSTVINRQKSYSADGDTLTLAPVFYDDALARANGLLVERKISGEA